MSGRLTIRFQAGVVILLFLGSLSTLLFNALSTLELPQREAETRAVLRDASRGLAENSRTALALLQGHDASQLAQLDVQLSAIAHRVLASFPGVEGGFYVDDGLDHFSGYAFPTGHPDVLSSLPRNEPPPLEAPYIRLQAQESLRQESGHPLFSLRDIGPSRVQVVTEPIGSSRPARATTWAMVRLTGPVQLERQVHGYQISLALALAGLLLAILLTLHLVRSLRRQAHAEENLKLELRRAEHLAALGKLLAGVAHEIRNPLAGIRSTVQLWDRLPDPARMRDAKDAVLAAVDRLHEIMSRLLYFARTDSSNRQPCSLNRIVEETLKLLEAQTVSQGVTVDLRLSPADPCIMGSPSALRQVVLNLVTNALQAMPDGGHLRCAIIHDKAAGTASMEVSDTGHGILPEARSHLFEPFFTTRPEGTGLGLALCQEIVAQHGGRLELAPPEQAQGTTFRVILPEGTLP